MQSPTPPSNTSKKNSPFRKWLPAIVLALVIHGVIIYFFLNSQKGTATEATATADNIATSTVPIDSNNQQEGLVTLQEKSYSSKEEQVANQDQESEEKQDKIAEQKTAVQQSEEDNTQTKATIDNNINSEKDVKVNNAVGSKPNQQSNKNSAPAQQQSFAMDNTSYLPPAQPNPNDQVLLSRDLPQAEQKVLDQNNDYAKAAEQSEDLSDQLSAIVNDVKEQKLRQIEAQQRASKEAYLSNQPDTANPATQETAATNLATDMNPPAESTMEKPVKSETEQQTEITAQ